MTARRSAVTSKLGRSDAWLVLGLLAVAACGGRSTHGGSPVDASGGAGIGLPTGGRSGAGTPRPTFEPGAPSEVLASIPTEYANLGTTVALSGDTLAVGAPGPVGAAGGDQPSGTPVPIPAVFVFRWDGAEWLEEAVLTVPDLTEPDPSDAGFGVTLALEGDTLVVGAPYQRPAHGSNGYPCCGRAHVFQRTGTEWHHDAELAPESDPSDVQFAGALAISDGVIAVGDPAADSKRGAVDLFANRLGSWRPVGVVQPAQPAENSGFGSSVALDHATLAVAASGRVYVFESSPSSEWILTSDSQVPNGFFANRIALRGDTLVIADYAESSNAAGVNGTPGAPYPADAYFAVHSGAAFVYRRGPSGWDRQAFLKSAHPVWEGLFGWDLALSDDTLLVAERQSEGHGAGFVVHEDESEPTTRGAVWVFQREDATWSLRGALKSPNGETAFASSVGAIAITERFVAVGAFADLTTPVDPASLGTPYAGGVFVWPR
jgi:hypothetical protein